VGPRSAVAIAALFALVCSSACVNRGPHALIDDATNRDAGDSIADTGTETGGLDSAMDQPGAGAGGAGGSFDDAAAAMDGAMDLASALGGASGAGGSAGADGGSGGAGGKDSGAGGAKDAGTAGADGAAGGTGGAPDAGITPCVPGISPANALLTDFSPASWNSTLMQWGVGGNLTGRIDGYGGGLTAGGQTTLITPTVDTTATNPALAIRGNVVAADYGGIAMSFDQCVDTAVYTGIRFTLGGTAAGCDLFLHLETYSQLPVANGGGCAGNCFRFPNAKIQVGAAPITTTFAALAGTGVPATAAGMRAELVGIQLQLQSPAPANGGVQASCLGVNLTLDNLTFVTN